MLIIRLQRVGKKNQPFFRVVLTEKTAPPKGKYIENLGYLDPRTKKCDFNVERIKYWLSKGAQPSDSAWNLFIKKGVIEGEKRKLKIKNKKEKKVEKEQKPKAETKA
ncbi:MAG TPA: 30S ribosomal protein S16 [Candidatus Pacearchaeota archaeon]|nr:30S ribosomal protein S16 [Candidatus Pacearchaeota archaeon]HOK94167.1 30S ribosomal protein S16 [Candidatus Pacearchaeota archaeon]HPO75193.1 30S ribosomal protein S16 [Candidatus Pacearchaeota archaeon]